MTNPTDSRYRLMANQFSPAPPYVPALQGPYHDVNTVTSNAQDAESPGSLPSCVPEFPDFHEGVSMSRVPAETIEMSTSRASSDRLHFMPAEFGMLSSLSYPNQAYEFGDVAVVQKPHLGADALSSGYATVGTLFMENLRTSMCKDFDALSSPGSMGPVDGGGARRHSKSAHSKSRATSRGSSSERAK